MLEVAGTSIWRIVHVGVTGEVCDEQWDCTCTCIGTASCFDPVVIEGDQESP